MAREPGAKEGQAAWGGGGVDLYCIFPEHWPSMRQLFSVGAAWARPQQCRKYGREDSTTCAGPSISSYSPLQVTDHTQLLNRKVGG
jgi:hypothetical protein